LEERIRPASIQEVAAREIYLVISGRERYYLAKRIMDISIALFLLILLSPLMLLIALLIFVYSPGPVFLSRNVLVQKDTVLENNPIGGVKISNVTNFDR